MLNDRILPFYNRLIKRAELIDLEQVEELKDRFVEILKRLEKGKYTAWKVDSEVEGYMYAAGTNIPSTLKGKAEPMMNSMRNVDSECRGLIVSLYDSDSYKPGDQSWEGLFS